MVATATCPRPNPPGRRRAPRRRQNYRGVVHPIEHLRYVARARGADASALVQETAHALSSMRFDPPGLVVACRRILERHPECGPLWWLCARLLNSPEPFELAWELGREIADDPTAGHLASCLPDDATVVTIGWPDLAGQAVFRRGDLRVLVVDSRHDGSSFVQRLERFDVPSEAVQPEALARAIGVADLVLLEAVAVSQECAVAQIGSAAAAAVARTADVPVWLVAGLGRRLPDPFVTTIGDRLDATAEAWDLDHDVFGVDAITHVVGPGGLTPSSAQALSPDCPLASELLRGSPT
jgi:hypothetical protein